MPASAISPAESGGHGGVCMHACTCACARGCAGVHGFIGVGCAHM